MKKDLISVNDVAKIFGVHPKSIYRRIWAKAIPAFKIGGRGNWKINRKDIPLMER